MIAFMSFGRVNRTHLVTHVSAAVGAGHDQQRQATGENRRAGHTDQAAHLHVAAITIARGECPHQPRRPWQRSRRYTCQIANSIRFERSRRQPRSHRRSRILAGLIRLPTTAKASPGEDQTRMTSGISGKYVATRAT